MMIMMLWMGLGKYYLAVCWLAPDPPRRLLAAAAAAADDWNGIPEDIPLACTLLLDGEE